MATKSRWQSMSSNAQGGVFFGAVAFVGLIVFTIWALQTEDRIVQYRNDDTVIVDTLLRKGWRIERTEVMKSQLFEVEIPVTTVTLSRSNWSKLWNG